MRRIIIHGLKPEYRGFVAAVQGWQQEFKQHGVGGYKKNDERDGSQGQGRARDEGDSKSKGRGKKFDGKCFNYNKKGHMAKDCWSNKKVVESNVATSRIRFLSPPTFSSSLSSSSDVNVATSTVEEEWDVEALFAFDKEDFTFTATTSNQVDFEKDWIVDSS
ncbi:hypothetical protein K1719_016847 [Acacia pycnantha]|nr:hypothetical protein K1719_016847 [Acacia pycnantha]